MRHALVRPEPAELLLVGELALERAEIRHHFLDVEPLQASGEELRTLADEVVALAQGERQAAALVAEVVVESVTAYEYFGSRWMASDPAWVPMS